eukprot:CAMPEP_0202854406 /NCGR_PEP_ID=MMETSP1389-20130828/90985_1 /ASSEMBLY_ACC=CAM_ASM_000865 /TAXON_ID=302021 /ORGANISM="Rhodomonas sp., Strain CCMP768" /LENGTH=296 /DNA_ID=CAMNT_0049532993 /DNA_START=1 /DNA_END=891 /DNA_ORIENTATION=+
MAQPADAITKVIVLGASGGFGTLFSQVLAKAGIQVRGISRKGTPKPEATFTDYLSADPCNPNEEVIARVKEANVIISCVPPGPCIRALEALGPHMSEGALFTDVLSVKTGICDEYAKAKDKLPHVELLSTHPMFAPAAGWEGQNTAIIGIRAGPRSAAFQALIESWGSKCIPMESGEIHDKVTAAVQNATHASLLSFGLCLSKMGYNAEMAALISTPPHRAMIGVIQRMASINEPDTYWDIQTENPNAEETWANLEAAVAEVHDAVKKRDKEAFSKIIAGFKPMLASSTETCHSPY